MKQTENDGFNVPEEHEFYGVAAQNENWEKLDATLTQKMCIRDSRYFVQ